MSVTKVTELFDDHDGDVNVDGHRWTRTFHVYTDDPTEWGLPIVLAQDPTTGHRIPSIGDPLTLGPGGIGADDTRCCVQSIRPQRVDGTPTLWKVMVEYSTRPMDTPGEIEPDPLLRPVEWSWSDITNTEEYSLDESGAKPGDPGKLVLNTAGVPFDPGLTREVTQHTLSLTWNAPTFDVATQTEYDDTVNNSNFTIGSINLTILAGCAKVAHNTATGPHIEGHFAPYVRRTVELHLRKARLIQWNMGETRWISGWDQPALSMGFQERKNKVDANGNLLLEYCLTPIELDVLDSEGKPTGEKMRPQEPVALNHIGQAVLGRPEGYPEYHTNPWVMLFRPYKWVDFSNIGFPQ